MSVLRALMGLVLAKLADLEFELVGHLGVRAVRRLHLRFMHVRHGRQIHFGKSVLIRNRGGLVLGERCGIGSYARIWNYDPIEIGDDFLAAGGLTINSAGHDPLTLKPEGGAIRIGHRVWCGVNVTILAGVSIGNDVVIGAGSVVAGDLPSSCIAVGVPARKIKELDRGPDPVLHTWARESSAP